MTLLIDCICTECGHTSTYFKEVGIDVNTKMCSVCGTEMRDSYVVAKECVEKMIDARKKEIVDIDITSQDSIMLLCPYCKCSFDFKTIEGNKNMWNVHENYMLIRCPLCAEWSKIDMEK